MKDFFYLYFCVEHEGKTKLFLNYKKAKSYYHSIEGVSKAYYGYHLWKKMQGFHLGLINPIVLEVTADV